MNQSFLAFYQMSQVTGDRPLHFSPLRAREVGVVPGDVLCRRSACLRAHSLHAHLSPPGLRVGVDLRPCTASHVYSHSQWREGFPPRAPRGAQLPF